jgi:hypothetical protein
VEGHAVKVNERDRRALLILIAALVVATVLRIAVFRDAPAAVAPVADTTTLAQQRLTRLRQVAATVPAREAMEKQAAADLAERERGILQADTAAQAQAALLELARNLGKNNQIDIRSGELGAPRAFGEYGLVYATVTFECHIEQLINFLTDISRQPELVAPSEERISTGNQKEKIMAVRMVLAGLVAKKLVPEKKGLSF